MLVDADNTQPAGIAALLAEIAKYGIASVRRAYGDWTTTRLASWKQVLNEHAIQPVQQFAYTSGKNATDSAMIIDAKDLLYGGRLQAFCIVSSDSDFTRLATRLRESGMTVYGVGETKTPRSFVSACDKFIYTEILLGDDSRYAKLGVLIEITQLFDTEVRKSDSGQPQKYIRDKRVKKSPEGSAAASA